MVAADLICAGLSGAAGAAFAIVGLLKSNKAPWLTSSNKGLQRLKVVQQPHPDWRPGKKQPPPFPTDDFVVLDPSQLPSRELYPFIISAVVPRPIAFVYSLSQEGIPNLAPYSYFGVMSHDPPVVCIGACATTPTANRKQPVKDSQQNIIETREWTLNMMSEWFVEAANHTCGPYDPEIDEAELSGLTAISSSKVKPKRIKESAVQMECRLRDTHEVRNRDGKVTATILIGEVVCIHANKHVCTKTKNGHTIVDLAKYAPVSRCGGVTYARTSEVYDMARPGREWQDASTK